MEDEDKTGEQLVDELVEVYPGVLVAQLNGKRDNRSMQQLAEQLRRRIERTNSSVVVVDVTCLPNIGTKIVQHLTDIVGAARLLGTQVLLARRDHSIDRKLVHLGVNSSDITMCHSLVAGLWAALDIVELEGEASSPSHCH